MKNKNTLASLVFGALFSLSSNAIAERIWPLEDPVIISCYGWRFMDTGKDWHDGIDLQAKEGTKVYAIDSGRVYNTCNSKREICNGYGTHVIIKHNDGKLTTYAHLSKINVKKGQKVKSGQRIGLSGNTGMTTAPHLHFEIHDSLEDLREDNDRFKYRRNPLEWLPEIKKLKVKYWLKEQCRDSIKKSGRQYEVKYVR